MLKCGYEVQSWFDERGARRFEPFLEFSNTILLVSSLPMGDLAIAVAVISSFAFDTARWLAFGQISSATSAAFADCTLKPGQRIIQIRLIYSAVLPMPK